MKRVSKFFPDEVMERDLWSLDKLYSTFMRYFNSMQGDPVKNYKDPPPEMMYQVLRYLLVLTERSINPFLYDTVMDHKEMAAILSASCSDGATGPMLANLKCFEKYNGQRYYFCEDFYKTLHQTSLENIRYSSLIQGSGVVKIPFPIIDHEGDEFDEFMFFIGKYDDFMNSIPTKHLFKGLKKPADLFRRKNVFCIAWEDNKQQWNYSTNYCTDENTLVKDILKDSPYVEYTLEHGSRTTVVSDGFTPHLRSIFNCLVYLKSGDPDLRLGKNDISYRSPNSTKIVKKDRNLSLNDFQMVGYSFKKHPLYTKEFYLQSPYYAPRGLLKISTWIKGSLKRRKAKLMGKMK